MTSWIAASFREPRPLEKVRFQMISLRKLGAPKMASSRIRRYASAVGSQCRKSAPLGLRTRRSSSSLTAIMMRSPYNAEYHAAKPAARPGRLRRRWCRRALAGGVGRPVGSLRSGCQGAWSRPLPVLAGSRARTPFRCALGRLAAAWSGATLGLRPVRRLGSRAASSMTRFSLTARTRCSSTGW